MLYEDLLSILQSTSLPWTYHHWDDPPSPPYGVYLDLEDDPFFADDRTYSFFRAVRLELYSLERDPALDQRVRDALDDAKLSYDVDYAYIESEGLHETIFEFEV